MLLNVLPRQHEILMDKDLPLRCGCCSMHVCVCVCVCVCVREREGGGETAIQEFSFSSESLF